MGIGNKQGIEPDKLNSQLQVECVLAEGRMIAISRRLEEYTLQHPQEVLIVTAEVEGEVDQIVIFKGFSSSLVQATAFDPDVPVLPESAKIIHIDRVASPYRPDSPQYLEKGLTWEIMEQRLNGGRS